MLPVSIPVSCSLARSFATNSKQQLLTQSIHEKSICKFICIFFHRIAIHTGVRKRYVYTYIYIWRLSSPMNIENLSKCSHFHIAYNTLKSSFICFANRQKKKTEEENTSNAVLIWSDRVFFSASSDVHIQFVFVCLVG